MAALNALNGLLSQSFFPRLARRGRHLAKTYMVQRRWLRISSVRTCGNLAGGVDMEDSNVGNSTSRSWFLFRPLAAMMSLPVDYRWEFTRRHPYYLQFWRRAAKYRLAPSEDARERMGEQAAALILGGIGISRATTPVDPRLGVEALGASDLGTAWAGGAVAPATFRTLAGMLLAGLPQAERIQLGRLLAESAEYDSRDSVQMGGI